MGCEPRPLVEMWNQRASWHARSQPRRGMSTSHWRGGRCTEEAMPNDIRVAEYGTLQPRLSAIWSCHDLDFSPDASAWRSAAAPIQKCIFNARRCNVLQASINQSFFKSCSSLAVSAFPLLGLPVRQRLLSAHGSVNFCPQHGVNFDPPDSAFLNCAVVFHHCSSKAGCCS